jgi:hypothetical protein
MHSSVYLLSCFWVSLVINYDEHAHLYAVSNYIKIHDSPFLFLVHFISCRMQREQQ